MSHKSTIKNRSYVNDFRLIVLGDVHAIILPVGKHQPLLMPQQRQHHHRLRPLPLPPPQQLLQQLLQQLRPPQVRDPLFKLCWF